jgi:hypothetical protein
VARASAPLGEEEAVNSMDDNTIAKASKALCFTPSLLQVRGRLAAGRARRAGGRRA